MQSIEIGVVNSLLIRLDPLIIVSVISVKYQNHNNGDIHHTMKPIINSSSYIVIFSYLK